MKDPNLHSNWTGRIPRTAHEAFGFDAPIVEPERAPTNTTGRLAVAGLLAVVGLVLLARWF